MKIEFIQAHQEDYFFSSNPNVDIALGGENDFAAIIVRTEELATLIRKRFGWPEGENAFGAAARFCPSIPWSKAAQLLQTAAHENWIMPTNIKRLIAEVADDRAKKILEDLSEHQPIEELLKDALEKTASF
ncbi:hypothetical protein ACFL29_01975 [Patescibacteria group bacterium]